MPAPSSSASSTATSRAASSTDTCAVLTGREVHSLLPDAESGKPGMTGGIPNCQWADPDGRFVQAAGIDASLWARSLPELIRLIQQSGQFSDSENMRKLREGAQLIAAGQDLNARQACSLFSRMLELQGQPAGTSISVAALPTRENPQAVTGQACSAGVYTSVMIADQRGLDDPLPVEAITRVLRSAHRRTVG